MRDRWWGHGQSYANETLFSFSPDDLSAVASTPFLAGRRGGETTQKSVFVLLHVFSLVMDVAQHVALSVCGEDVFFFLGPINFHSILRTYSRRPGDLISTGQGVVLFSSKPSRRFSPSGPGFSFKPSDDTTVIK
jgi:hypothetical protein